MQAASQKNSPKNIATTALLPWSFFPFLSLPRLFASVPIFKLALLVKNTEWRLGRSKRSYHKKNLIWEFFFGFYEFLVLNLLLKANELLHKSFFFACIAFLHDFPTYGAYHLPS